MFISTEAESTEKGANKRNTALMEKKLTHPAIGSMMAASLSCALKSLSTRKKCTNNLATKSYNNTTEHILLSLAS